MEILERLANKNEPPLRRSELEKIREALGKEGVDKTAVRERLGLMKEAFQKRGDVTRWSSAVLDKIDVCFEEQFTLNGEVSGWVFYPDSAMNLNKADKYYSGVDRILATHADLVPRYARDWFAYFRMWDEQGYAFPMPLGTCSAVGIVEKLAVGNSVGIIEVRVCSVISSLFFYSLARAALTMQLSTRHAYPYRVDNAIVNAARGSLPR